MSAKRVAMRETDAFSAQLLSQVQAVEGQLRALRAEHEALRRCLDRAGVLSARELEGELQRVLAGKDAAPRAEAHKQGGAPPSPPASPSAAALRTQGTPVAKPELQKPTHFGAAPPSPPRSPSAGGRRTQAARPGPAARQRSPPRAAAVAVAAAGADPKLALPSRSSRGLAEDGAAAAERRPAAPPSVVPAEAEAVDLFECISKLLDRDTSIVEQQKAFKAFQQAMKNPVEPPNSWNGPGCPLSTVVRAGRVDLARLLLRSRANANQRDPKGVSPLHLATFDGNYELCRLLLLSRADVDACDRHGQTPLFFAPTRDLCKLLLEKRSDVTVLNRKGQSALHLAGRAGLHDVLDWFASRVNKGLLELRDSHGATARHYIMQSGVPKPETAASSPRAASPRAARRPSVSTLATAIPRRPAGAATNHLQADDGRRASLPSVSELVGGPGCNASGGASASTAPAGVSKVGRREERSPSPSKRPAEHFQIGDALEAEAELKDESHPLSPSCEEMFAGLGPGLTKVQAHEVLAAAVGVATAAVATAAVLDAAAAEAAAQASCDEAKDAPELEERIPAEELADLGIIDDVEEVEADDAELDAGDEVGMPQRLSKLEDELDDEVF